MANDRDGLTTGALLIGGGLAGYALGRWLDRDEYDRPAAAPSPEPTVAPPPAGVLDVPVSSPSQVSERNGRSTRSARRYSREGRTILRDGVAVLRVERVDLGDQRYELSPYETDVLTKKIVRLLDGSGAHRDGRKKEPWYRERWLVDDRCGYRAYMFWTGAPPETAVVGDVWAYVEKPNGQIIGKRRFRTKDEGLTYVRASLRRALERAGKYDCYDY